MYPELGYPGHQWSAAVTDHHDRGKRRARLAVEQHFARHAEELRAGHLGHADYDGAGAVVSTS